MPPSDDLIEDDASMNEEEANAEESSSSEASTDDELTRFERWCVNTKYAAWRDLSTEFDPLPRNPTILQSVAMFLSGAVYNLDDKPGIGTFVVMDQDNERPVRDKTPEQRAVYEAEPQTNWLMDVLNQKDWNYAAFDEEGQQVYRLKGVTCVKVMHVRAPSGGRFRIVLVQLNETEREELVGDVYEKTLTELPEGFMSYEPEPGCTLGLLCTIT